MANTKNIIQNIPLTGTLNLNTLKTDVKPFNGYNEKNTTVFGGTLSPVYAKQESLYSLKDSYTLYDQNGTPITLYAKSDGYVSLYKGTGSNTKTIESRGLIPYKREIKTPTPDAIFAATIAPSEGLRAQFCIEKDSQMLRYKYGFTDNIDEDIDNISWDNGRDIGFVPDCASVDYDYRTGRGLFVAAKIDNAITEGSNTNQYKLKIFTFYFEIPPYYGYLAYKYTGSYTSDTISTSYMESVPTISLDADKLVAYVSSNSGKIKVGDPVISVKAEFVEANHAFTFTKDDTFVTQSANFWADTWYKREESGRFSDFRRPLNQSAPYGTENRTYDVNQFAERVVDIKKNGMVDVYQGDLLNHSSYYHYLTGQDGNGFIPSTVVSPKRSPLRNYWEITDYTAIGIDTYYINGQLLSISAFGVPLASVSSYDSHVISLINNFCRNEFTNQYSDWTNFFTLMTISFKSGGKWYSVDFFKTNALKIADKSKVLKKMVLNEDTIWMPQLKPYYNWVESSRYLHQLGYGYSISKDEYKEINIGYISNQYPYYYWEGTLTDTYIDNNISTTGAIFGGGYNAGYTVSGASNIGYLPNPSLMTYVPTLATMLITNSNPKSDIQLYCTLGLTVQSATYVGTDSRYYGTVISIDGNGNIPLPLFYGAEIIPGYSNNDLVNVDGTIYPLIYYNNNQKINGFYLLSMLENMKGSFSLQGQSYVFDNDNIYAATFDSGIVGQVQEVAYKRNLQFIGTLPTRAIFYSKFNKTFYVFTGDRNLTKMMEASYLNDIYYVGQNPSTLSIWICTDKGIYVMSDEDMYKLDFISDRIVFAPDYTIIDTNDGAYNQEIRVALYEVQEGMTEIPVRLLTSYYGVSTEMKANMDCWYIRVFNQDRREGYVKVNVNTITDTAKEVEEKTFYVEPKDYDMNNTIYIRYQPKYQECVAMQLGLESNLGIYELALGLNSNDSTAQVGKFNF